MQSQKIKYLLDRYIRGQLTDEEQQELAGLFQDPEQESFVQAELTRLMQEDEGAAAGADALAGPGAVETAGWKPVLERVLAVDKTAGSTDVWSGAPAGERGRLR